MLPRIGAAVAIATAAIALVIVPAAAGQGSELEMYTLRGPGDKIAKGAAGVELAGQRQTASGLEADAVLTRSQVSKLRASGVKVSLTRNKKGQTVTEQARAMAAAGFDVYRSWDEPGGIRDELSQIASQNPQLVKLVEGPEKTNQGRDLIALKVTQNANVRPDGSRPAVLYSSNQHAREWISLEVNRRLLHWFIDHKNDSEIKELLRTTELWFVISANPDGYQFTFDPAERLWRKNLREQPGRRRRRSEPQLRLEVGLRQRGLLAGQGR
jgi:murein tripeptide amidase MpaA